MLTPVVVSLGNRLVVPAYPSSERVHLGHVGGFRQLVEVGVPLGRPRQAPDQFLLAVGLGELSPLTVGGHELELVCACQVSTSSICRSAPPGFCVWSRCVVSYRQSVNTTIWAMQFCEMSPGDNRAVQPHKVALLEWLSMCFTVVELLLACKSG
jgi:hypothetical protein